jgi:hypothetical protein
LTVVLNTNKTDHHSIIDKLLTVVLNTNKTDHHCITDLLLIVSGVKHGGQFYWCLTPLNNSSVILWWSVLLVFNTTVYNNSVILWWSVLITELLLTVVLNTNKTDDHSIIDKLLTVVLNTNKTDHHCITDLLLIVSGVKHHYTVVVSFSCV